MKKEKKLKEPKWQDYFKESKLTEVNVLTNFTRGIWYNICSSGVTILGHLFEVL